jgi:hypothetical protein
MVKIKTKQKPNYLRHSQARAKKVKNMEIVPLERYEGLNLRDFLKMDREEWKKFVESLGRVVLEPSPDWTRVEAFLAERGLYVWLDLSYLKYALDEWRGWKLYEVAKQIAEKMGMKVVASIQPPTFGMAGSGYVYPEERERELLEVLEKSKTFEELALQLLQRYGPCILFEVEDDSDYALLCCVPKSD